MKILRYDLPKIIINDLLVYGKTHLILLIIIILSANAVITSVYKTRLLVTEEEKLTLDEKEKNDEWRNLIIEKNSFSIRPKIKIK